ncbi:hypothetical protein Rhopal_005825-T1 [Rhodotorula paludigena]|uniref:Uncharacterized protein n=1 Tax=Rhodotorula paludigena TaxID=86838 RepID=A0AAV5GTT9_9BASI|nr:hypothetical protein Rhopal_005825-T1 [Rhodotorula paludigena]
MGLSSGTLGLKFMNRAQPAGVQAAPNKDNFDVARGATKITQHAGLASRSAAVADQAGQVALDRDEDWSRRTVAGQSGRRTVVHESSLLSFPLLSTLNSASSTSTASFSSSATSYSSMPLTAGAISGRRSYGGANVEIEKLNDPSSHQKPTSTSASGESKSALKKRLKAERDAAPVSVRRSGSSSVLSDAKAGKRVSQLDAQGEGSGGKRRRTGEFDAPAGQGEMDAMRWEADDDQVALTPAKSGGSGGAEAPAQAQAASFARPSGFEGARKSKARAPKGKGKSGLMDDDYRWGKEGEMREWDEGKEDDSDEESASEDEGLLRDDDEADSDEDEVVEEPTRGNKGAKPGKDAAKKAQARREVEDAIGRSEERRMAVGKRRK